MKTLARLILKILPKNISNIIKNIYHQSQRDKLSPNWDRVTNFKPKKEIVLGFVGAGRYAQHHLKSFSKIQNVNLKYLLSATGRNSEQLTNEYKFQETYTDITEFMKNDVDGYVIVSSSSSIYNIAKKLFSKKKPILIEKPPGFTSTETKDLAEIASKNKTFGMVALNRRYYSDIQHGLAMLADYGPIRGAILEVPADISKKRSQKKLTEIEYQKYFIRNSIHGFDTLRHIMGGVKKLKSMGETNSENLNRGLSGGAVIEHKSGTFSIISTLWDSAPYYWKIKIIGERGYLEYSEKGGTKFTDSNMNIYNIPIHKIDSDFKQGNYMQALEFVKSISTKTHPQFPACSLEDALETILFMEDYEKGLNGA